MKFARARELLIFVSYEAFRESASIIYVKSVDSTFLGG